VSARVEPNFFALHIFKVRAHAVSPLACPHLASSLVLPAAADSYTTTMNLSLPSSWPRAKLFSFSLLALAVLQLKHETYVIGTLRANQPVDKIKKPTKTTRIESNHEIQKGKESIKAPPNKVRNATTVPAAQTKKSTRKEKDSPKTRDKARNQTIAIQATTKEDTAKKDHSHKFNYTAFWEDAMDAAFASLKTEETQATSPSPCPKVYVYDLPGKLRDGPRTKTKKNTFGSKVDNGRYRNYLYGTNQYALPSILEYRLRTSKQCRTDDPNEADLFYAPVLTKPKFGRAISNACHKINGKMVRDALPHLNATNACRHFFALGKGMSSCVSTGSKSI